MSTTILENSSPIALTARIGRVAIERMASFGKALKRLRESKGWTQEELARRAEISSKSISDWENLDAPKMQGAKLAKVAAALGLTVSELEREWRPQGIDQSIGDPGRRGIPLINKAPAGTIVDYQECSMADSGQGHWYIERDGVADPHAFAVVIVGDSMMPLLRDGVIAVFSPMTPEGKIRYDQAEVEEGSIVFVRFGPDAPAEGCTVASVHKKGEKTLLKKLNSKYKAIICGPEDIQQMAVLIRLDMYPGVTKTRQPKEQLTAKGEKSVQVEGSIHPNYDVG